MPSNLTGAIKQLEIPLDNPHLNTSSELKALAHNARNAHIGCKQATIYSYTNAATVTQSFNSWLTSQHLQAVAADEIRNGTWLVEPNPSNTSIYWKAENNALHYAGVWLSNGQGGRLLMCSGEYVAPSALENVHPEQNTAASQPTRRSGGWLWLFAIIVGSAIARKASKGFSHSNLD